MDNSDLDQMKSATFSRNLHNMKVLMLFHLT